MDSASPPRAPRAACRTLPPERFLVPNVRLFDPEQGLDLHGDLLVSDGKIADLGPAVGRPRGVEVLGDLAGCWVFPGLVDPHVHLRTPGLEYKEDLESGSAAAAAGGYVAVVAMANTEPVIDCGPLVSWVLDQASTKAWVRVAQVGAVSKGQKGEELAELWDLTEAGAVAFADDGKPVADADLLLHALRYARGTARPVLLHVENRSLSVDGVMREGRWSARLGLRGIPAVCESGPLARDLELVRYVAAEEERRVAARAGHDGGSAAAGSVREGWQRPLVHFQHLSVAGSVRLLREAKEEGLPVTAEVTPLHLLLTDERLCSFDTNLKVNPPLGSEQDRVALVSALADGTIDCVGSDHAPHAPQEKEVPIEEAAWGSTGLETAFSALYSGLVRTGQLPLRRLLEAMSSAPCRVLGLTPPHLAVGASADFCVFDPEESWQVTAASLRGKSRNCAFLGESFTGRVRMTVVDGSRRFLRARGEA
jgi:dihydroorotase